MTRTTETALAPIFLERWSPRAFDGQAMPHDDLMTILDAARWAPSAYNVQPWRLLYATRGDANWARFLDLLIPFNQSWAKDAAALLFIVSSETSVGPEGETPLYSHSFDAGAAWAQLGLQAVMLGYHAHAMTGIDFDRIPAELAIPAGFRVEAAVAIGRKADPSVLPESLRAMDVPSARKPMSEVAFAGNFAG